MKDPRPLDPSLARLLRAERDAEGPTLDAEARAWERLELSLGGGGGEGGGDFVAGSNRMSGAMLRSRTRGWGRLVRVAAVMGIFAFGVAVGIFGSRFFRTPTPPHIVYVERPVPATPPTTPPTTSTAPPSSTAPETTLEFPDDTVSSPQTAPPLPASRQLAGERALLDVARAALNRGEGEEALRATARHKSRFPAGMLAEEREALSIQALLLLTRGDEAKRRAARFEQRYPRSVLLPMIQAALAAAP